jgi:hypothetical protein
MAAEEGNGKQQIDIQLTITGEDGSPRVPLTIDRDITATQLLTAVVAATDIPSTALKLIYRGRLIKPDDTVQAVSEYRLDPGSVIHCMGKPVKKVNAAATTGGVFAAGTTLPSVTTTTATATTASSSMATTTATTTTTRSTGIISNVTEAIANLRSLNAPDVAATAISTLDKLLNNIIAHPLEIKYRRIKKNNVAFGRRLGQLPGGHDALLACGFVVQYIDGEDQYELVASEESWNRLVTNQQLVETAVRQSTTTTRNLFPSAAFGNAAAAGMGGMPPAATAAGAGGVANLLSPEMMMAMMNGGGGGNNGMMMPDLAAMNTPEMQAMVQQLLSNPAQVTAMLRVRTTP